MNWIRAAAVLFVLMWLPSAAAQNPRGIEEICAAAQPAEQTPMQFQAAEAALAEDTDYRAVLCTTAGPIYVDLYENLTPLTVNNFVFLAQQGYYDSTTFHRVIPDFMAQAGDPTASGRGGPGYQFPDEPIGFLAFDRPGLLAMANAGPGTNGSQFFITTAAAPHLNYRHTIFGDVLLGQENARAIRQRDPQTAAEPGETLRTILIITDPTAVDNTGIIELEAATQEEVIAAFASLRGDAKLSTAEDILKALPADLQGDFADFADVYGHQYRYGAQILNRECSSEMFFSSLGYQVDVFESREAAANALNDSFMFRLITSQGFASAEEGSAFLQEAPTCAGEDGFHILSLYTRGRYLVAIQTLVSGEILAQISADDLLHNLASQIERAFTAVYASEIR